MLSQKYCNSIYGYFIQNYANKLGCKSLKFCNSVCKKSLAGHSLASSAIEEPTMDVKEEVLFLKSDK